MRRSAAPISRRSARPASILSNEPRDFKKGFDEIGQKLITVAEGRYVLSFCSTKKKGSHKLEVEVVAPNDSGKVTHKFNASGFRPSSCTPKIKPLFEEVEALKAETAEKEKEIKERVAQEEAKEAEKLQQGLLGPPTKEAGKETAKEAAKEPSKDVAKETVKPASVKEPPKAAPPPSSPSRQATDNE